MELTPVQSEVLRIIGKWFNTYGRSPSLREIGKRRDRGGQVRSIVQVLDYLKDKGYIQRTGPRGIKVLPKGDAFLRKELADDPCLEDENPYL